MEVTEIIKLLQEKFGNKLDVSAVTQQLAGFDHSKMNFNEILGKLNINDLVGDLDGDGVKEGIVDELKGVAAKKFGGLGGLFGGK